MTQGFESSYNHTTGHTAVYLHYTADPKKRDEEWIAQRRRRMKRWLWQREMEIDFSSRGGELVFPMVDRQVHVRRDPEHSCCIIFGMDHGRVNPTAALWLRIFPAGEDRVEGDLYAYREYYQANRPIGVNARAIREMMDRRDPYVMLCDPSMNSMMQNERTTIREKYEQHGVGPLTNGDRAEEPGIEEITNYLMAACARWSVEHDRKHRWFASEGYTWDQIQYWARQPALYMSPRCTNLYRELKGLRRDDDGPDPDKNRKEGIKDCDNHLFDALKYVVNDEPTYRSLPPLPPQPGTFGERAQQFMDENDPNKKQHAWLFSNQLN